MKTISRKCVMEMDYSEITDELTIVSLKLYDLLPDPSIGPMERIERLTRVVPNTMQLSEYSQTARAKLKKIRDRLNEAVPDEKLNSIEKINFLIAKVNELVPEETDRICQKLQFLADRRLRDNGSTPFAGWKDEYRDHDTFLEAMRKSGQKPQDMKYIDEEKYREEGDI